MNQPAKAQEPSMEEILASIRRIIADDDSKPPPRPQPVAAAPKPAAPPPRPVQPPPKPEPVQQHEEMLAPMEPAPEPEPEPQDVLDLTEQMTETAVEPPSFQTIDGQSDVVFADPQPEPPPRPVEPPRVFAPLPPQDGLMSSSTSAAVDSAFNSLAHTVLVQNARTLEDLVREMLRPMLKSWLDDNLPSMVERIVKLEIERVSRGRG
jgi:cell pole-organizing protein PopZ